MINIIKIQDNAMKERKIKFFVMDVDGTLTDGKLHITDTGEIFKSFDVKDGYGIIDILPHYSIVPIIISARESKIVSRRCLDLKITELHQGVRQKYEELMQIISTYSERDNKGYSLSNVAYIGDDILDIQCMKPIKEAGGMVGCPNDAVNEIKQIADFVSSKNGGNGAVREFIEWLITDKNNIIW